jgi:hypothetical protein
LTVPSPPTATTAPRWPNAVAAACRAIFDSSSGGANNSSPVLQWSRSASSTTWRLVAGLCCPDAALMTNCSGAAGSMGAGFLAVETGGVIFFQ